MKPTRNRRTTAGGMNILLCLFLMGGGVRAAEDSTKGSITVISLPKGANVFLNGKAKGKTPATLSGLPSGQYRIELRKAGYDRAYKGIGLLEGQAVETKLEMKKTTGLLLVNSTPDGAKVIIQGEEKGTTPALITDLPLGNYLVEIHATGLPVQELKVELPRRMPVQVHVRQPPRVAVNSDPPGAEIFIRNESVGKTPLVLSKISEGALLVVAKMAEHDTQQKTITLAPGLNAAVEFTLVKNSGMLVIDTEPALVHVYVDGVRFATTQPKGGADSISQPLRIALKSGVDHRIQLVRNGYISESMVVRTKVDQVVTHHHVLKRIFIYDTKIITDSEVIKCRLEYKLPNGDIYYERFPGVYQTAKAADIHDVQPISINDKSNNAARLLIEESKPVVPE